MKNIKRIAIIIFIFIFMLTLTTCSRDDEILFFSDETLETDDEEWNDLIDDWFGDNNCET